MMFFKGLHWYEWLLIGIVVASLGVTKVLWDKYDTQSKVVGTLGANNSVLSETVKYQDASATITDTVVTAFVQEKNDVKIELDKSREGVINEYIDMAGGQTGAITPLVNHPAPPVASRPTKVQVRATQPAPIDAGISNRLSVLADRMHIHYCSAAPVNGIDCNTIGTNK